MEFYLIRHGSTKLNGSPAEDKIRGWVDIPLSDEWIQEIMELAKKLPPLDFLIASDLIRTKQTAMVLHFLTGVPIKWTTRWLRPWNLWIFQWQHSKLVHPQIEKYVVDTPDKDVPKWESFNDFKQRLVDTVRQIASKRPDARIWLVTHHRDERLLKALDHWNVDFEKMLGFGSLPGNCEKVLFNS